MSIFSEFEGLSGENLSSAILHYLLLNSEEVRDSFISLLSRKSPDGIIDYRQHFSIRKEYPTQDEKLGNGRLDLLLQVDEFVIGIENKFHASFQPNQPEKYQSSINKVADLMGEINQAKVSPLLFILCPEYKLQDAQEKIKLSPHNMGVVTWEEIHAELDKIESVLNPVANMVLRELKGYLVNQFSFMPLYNKKYHHLRSSFPEYGTSLQHELISQIWGLFPNPVSNLSNGKEWIGYPFLTDLDNGQRGWYGFLPKTALQSSSDNEAELIIATTYELASLGDGLTKVELDYENFLGDGVPCYAYKVEFDETWNTQMAWEKRLSVPVSAT
ncbi:PD-(D/E)XK nuclease family protein [Vibrio europaeus]|uniref:PD-(D/E)XK nuclease family protein n=1 Tax=Vibrio europaeus TaxID=300876 RepID=UPI0018A748CD|nr:PD-(D/E)XK nuclease family protein [Vibrio europaeus]MDC5805214.1 PD-(D/E)XK nuclease family protein [Vibrio europaeus]MDC5811481.1 PD-(D/E)XK nuclease family protein [Vibrio europaeus]MDC5826711.1 PD-(D/E)XK nuclease family protein [Vibrio europaeus]MDC5832077.1 PD-(D/E)XK nuclease family protein [Vibrio europaeus]MDC5835032.1 PD-(D/E)XK nuclease family protein [Vibrio europaeus]